MKRDFWPCVDVYDDDGKLSSVIFTDFHRLARKYPKASSGYTVERLVKSLAPPELKKRVRFDPESSMFAAYGGDADALFEIAMLIKKATGQKKPAKHHAQLAPDAARAALRAGFVESLDAKAQQTFLRGWPRPPDPGHAQVERELRARDAKTRLAAARRLMRDACGVVGNIHRPISHPTTFDFVAARLASERDELVFALAMMCNRALPDQRMQPVLERYLASPRWRVRWAAVDGLGALHRCDWSKLLPLLDDPHDKVRAAVCRAAWEDTVCSWAIGDPELLRATPFPAEHIARLEAKLADKACRQFATNALARIRDRLQRGHD